MLARSENRGGTIESPADRERRISRDPRFSDVTSKYAAVSVFQVIAEHQATRDAFKKALGKDFLSLVDRLEMGSPSSVSSSGYFCGEGFAPHMGGDDEAIACLDIYSGQAYAAVLYDGKRTQFYGSRNRDSLPDPLLQWLEEREREVAGRRP